MAGSVQSAKALAELQAVTKSSDDPDFDMNIEVGDRNARGGSGSSDGGNTPQGEQQQQAPRPRPMPALGGDPLRELRGGTSYVSAPPLPTAPSRFVDNQSGVPQGSAAASNSEGQGGAARLPVQGQVAQQGAPAQAGRPGGATTLSEQSRRPANMPSVVVRAAPIRASSPASRAEMRRAERAEAARQNSHMMAPIRLDPSRAVQSAASKMSPEAAGTPTDWSAIARVNAPVPAGTPAIAQAISALKRSSWGATQGAASAGGQRSDGVDPDPMVRFANEHTRKRQALDVLFERFARIEATPVATAPRAAPMPQRPVPPRLTPMMAPRRNAFQ